MRRVRDIRDPLNSIQVAAHVLSRTAAPESPAKKQVDRVTRAVSRIQHIVGDLLDLSREREGTGICVERTPTDLRAMCQNVADDVKAIAIRMVLPRNMPAP